MMAAPEFKPSYPGEGVDFLTERRGADGRIELNSFMFPAQEFGHGTITGHQAAFRFLHWLEKKRGHSESLRTVLEEAVPHLLNLKPGRGDDLSGAAVGFMYVIEEVVGRAITTGIWRDVLLEFTEQYKQDAMDDAKREIENADTFLAGILGTPEPAPAKTRTKAATATKAVPA